jgi:hypothetical protein
MPCCLVWHELSCLPLSNNDVTDHYPTRYPISMSRQGRGGHPGYEVIQQIAGAGGVLAAAFVAEIGDVQRFATAGGCAREPG